MKNRSLIIFFIIAIVRVHSQTSTCTTPDNLKGTCKPIKTCDHAVKILQSRPLTDEKKEYLRKSQCKQDTQPWVCCPVPVKKLGVLPVSPNCGTDTEDRIVGGEATNIYEFPWIAHIGYDKSGGKKGYHCGGSLINERYVITAAHCVQKIPTTYKLSHVKLGEWDTLTNPDCQSFVNEKICNDPHLIVNVEEITVHQNYEKDSRNQHHDIALLRLASKVAYTSSISPICLPVDAQSKSKIWENIALTVAGWGKTEYSPTSTKKLKVDVEGDSLTNCRRIYGAQGLTIIDEQICAGGEKGKDSCNGDSGGPLMGFYSKPVDHYTLVGLVSYGPKNCGTKDLPGVYTRISKYMDWIQKNIYE